MNAMTTPQARPSNTISAKPGPFTVETVLEVKHYTDLSLIHISEPTRPY